MKKFLSLLLIVCLYAVSVSSVMAVGSDLLIGDVDLDGRISVKDATLIQKYVASLKSLSVSQLVIADVDISDNVNVKDATMIQKKIAGIIDEFPSNNEEGKEEENDTSKPTEPPHTHSYSKKVVEATCTEKGYTTYTCSCGDTYIGDYTNPSHIYTEFICRPCGAIDKDNAYKFLVEHVKSNGTVNGSFISITMREVDGKKYELKYDAQYECLWATCYQSTQKSKCITTLLVEDGFYGLEYVYDSSITSDLTGFIEPKTFNENSAMTYEDYIGLDSAKLSMLNLARSSLVLTVVEMERYFDTNNVGLNVYALGYMGLQ